MSEKITKGLASSEFWLSVLFLVFLSGTIALRAIYDWEGATEFELTLAAAACAVYWRGRQALKEKIVENGGSDV